MSESKNSTITIKNNLEIEKRDLNVYFHAIKSANIVSHNSSITRPLGTVEQGDYLHISVVSGPGYLYHPCAIDLPAWADFEFSSEGKVTITHSENRTQIKLPPGPPDWQLKITRPPGSAKAQTPGYIIVGGGHSPLYS